MNGEVVLDTCETDQWTWVCTDQRVMKYQQGAGTVEEMHDISFEEISSISLVNEGRNGKLLTIGAVSIGLSALLAMVTFSGASSTFGLIFLVFGGLFGGLFIWGWMNSEISYFEFKGGGLISSNADEWRIDRTGANNPDDIREFTKTVRGQL